MLSLRGYILAKMGRTTDAEQVLNTLNGIAGDRYVPPYAMALVHAGLGQTDQAFQWLDKAANERDVHLVLARAGSQVGPLPQGPTIPGAPRTL